MDLPAAIESNACGHQHQNTSEMIHSNPLPSLPCGRNRVRFHAAALLNPKRAQRDSSQMPPCCRV
jgi:hypothetical protein